MSDFDFDQVAEDTMLEIEEAIDASGADIDYDNVSDILTLEFSNGSKIIINKQAPLSQLWVAARSGGYHFDYLPDEESWQLQGSGEELFTCLGRYCSEQAGEDVVLERQR